IPNKCAPRIAECRVSVLPKRTCRKTESRQLENALISRICQRRSGIGRTSSIRRADGRRQVHPAEPPIAVEIDTRSAELPAIAVDLISIDARPTVRRVADLKPRPS